MLKYLTVEVRINEHHTQRLSVPAWEVAVLQAVHPNDEIKQIEEVPIARETPNAEDEFRRLSARYGTATLEDGTKGIPFVAAVYGQFGIGTGNLEKAIREAEIAEPEAIEGFTDLVGDAKQVSSVGG